MKYVSTFLAAALLAGSAMAADTGQAARDQFRELRGEARQIRSSALYIERLAGESATTWAQVDKQWNEIKPAQEAMNDHLSWLEAHRKTLTPEQQHALEIARPNVDKIASGTHQLRSMLDSKNADVKSAQFKSTGEEMAREASAIGHSTDQPVHTASR